MEMLVTKFSKGKYRNEGELFNEPISNENVKLMGEMIALQALRTVKKYDMKIADKLYIGLIKDLHHMNEIDYIVSDGYDVAQTAICFLYQFTGERYNDAPARVQPLRQSNTPHIRPVYPALSFKRHDIPLHQIQRTHPQCVHDVPKARRPPFPALLFTDIPFHLPYRFFVQLSHLPFLRSLNSTFNLVRALIIPDFMFFRNPVESSKRYTLRRN